MKLFIIIGLFIIAFMTVVYLLWNKDKIKKNGFKLPELSGYIFTTVFIIFITAWIFVLIDTANHGLTYEYKDSVVIQLDLIEGELDKIVTIKKGKLEVAWNDEKGVLNTVTIRTTDGAINKYCIKNGDVEFPCLEIRSIKNTSTFSVLGIIPMKIYSVILPMNYRLKIGK